MQRVQRAIEEAARSEGLVLPSMSIADVDACFDEIVLVLSAGRHDRWFEWGPRGELFVRLGCDIEDPALVEWVFQSVGAGRALRSRRRLNAKRLLGVRVREGSEVR